MPQPRLATIDLGSAAPGFDGTGSFYSYDSDLSPDATMAAYTAQLLRAGFHEDDRSGIWRVFIGPRLTVWVRVGSGGPPTTLVVRVEPTVVEVADGPALRPSTTPARGSATGGSSAGTGLSRPTSKPAAPRQPDPPHGTTATAAGGGSGGSTTIASGPSSGSSTSLGTGTGTGTTTGTGTGGHPTGTGSDGDGSTRP